MPDSRQRIKDFLASQRNEQTLFLAELVKVASDNPPGDCAPHAERAAALLESLGLEVERHPVLGREVAENGMESCINLVVRERFGPGGLTVALNAHGDVVPPGLGWTTDPYGAEIRDDRMYGRGVAVSKSDFATYTWALLALKASGAALAGALELHFTYDEEVGGNIGPKWLLDQGITRPDFAMCAGFSYGITTAHNGCLHLEVEVLGLSGHAAMPDRGRDALHAATQLLTAIYAYRDSLGARRSAIPGIDRPTLVVGLIEGGINTNVVPDRVGFRLDRRIIPEENPGEAERELISLIESKARELEGITVNVKRVLLARPFTSLPGQEKLVAAIARNVREVFGADAKPHGVPIYTDARHYSEAGIPTVLYGAGPRTLEEANGHRADENLVLDDLYRATEVVALTMLELLNA